MKPLLAEIEFVSHQTASPDSVNVGGGGSGKAAALNLAKKGIRVICIEPGEPGCRVVGKSLDSSALALGSDRGLPWSH
jgi:glycine/D-amino acid oxidase-like deaminating enzyme